MYVKTRDLTLAAACLALSMLLILAESVLRISTLFLLSLSGFLIGIVIREAGLKLGGIYFIASVPLSMIIAPDKMKLVVFIGAELYILLREGAWEYLEKNREKYSGKVRTYYFFSKLLAFHLIFLPILLFLPNLIMKDMDFKWKIMIVLLSEPIWYFFDLAYDRFQIELWNRMKHKK